MARQGECVSCGIRWTWFRDIPIVQAHCPHCRRRLNKTTRFARLRPVYVHFSEVDGPHARPKNVPEFP